VEPTEHPDEKDDREGYTDQPEQKTSTHRFLLFAGSPDPTSSLSVSSLRADEFADDDQNGRRHLSCGAALPERPLGLRTLVQTRRSD
jgi:hypothetical protein